MSLSHLLLGLLHDNPQSGYDLNKSVQLSVQNFWTTDQSQIYRTLHRLQDDGWIRMEYVKQDNNPDKKIYHLSEMGRIELMRWITTPLASKDAPIREGWLGQIYFAYLVSHDEIIQLLKTYHDEVRVRILHLKLIKQALAQSNQNPWSIGLTLDYGIHIQGAVLEWIEKTIKYVNELQETSTNLDT